MGPQDSPVETAAGARVLVVEDDVHIRDLVVLHLQLEGLTTVSAGTGAEGLRLAKADPFDLLILDVMLPELDGVTVCRAVRREAMNGDVPILMLTALLIFRLAHNRLRALEQAARALGEGRTDVRATETGGDEVSSLARTFNRMAADLGSRAAALTESDRARRQLLADVSHELMTPLAAIRGYVETLGMPNVPIDPPTRSRYLAIVEEETHKLEAMIGDLLDLARLEGGGDTLRLESVSVADLFIRVADRHLPAMRERGIRLEREIAPGTADIRGDAARLEQAIQNLAANAIRHTPVGGQVLLQAAPANGQIRVVVRDTGSGIPAEHLPRVFDRFYKVDASRAGTTVPSGSGLGLSIVRAIVERHGGRVSASNSPEGGAAFELLLPSAQA